MEEKKQYDVEKNRRERLTKNPLLRKVIFLILLAVALWIPLLFINDIIDQRGDLYYSTATNLGNEWGKKQRVIAPVLVFSYPQVVNSQSVQNHIAVLPDKLDAKIILKDEIRKRGIYKTTVYTANVKLTGYFSKDKIPQEKDMLTFLSFGLSDTKAILKINEFTLGKEKNLKLDSGTKAELLFTRGISSPVKNLETFVEDKIPFSIDIDFRGSSEISILPLGEENKIQISSAWNSPSFEGILPENREISDQGFQAEWNVSHLVRSYSQILPIGENFSYPDFRMDHYDGEMTYYDDYSEDDSSIRVSLYNSVSNYSQIARAGKYGILFIMLSMIVVYIFEVASKKFTHYIQYGVVGFSLVVFYLMLLSLSEHFSFEISYFTSSLAIIIPNSLYIGSLTKNKKFGFGMMIFLTGIYAILFSILRMEQYALLTGTILIVAVLYIVMYLTRKLDVFLE